MDAEKTPLTPEQILEMREKTKKYYKDQIPFLKVQSEYETLLATIAEARYRTDINYKRIAEMHASEKEPDDIKKTE